MPKKIDEVFIFETAVAILLKRGYDGTTTREIAANGKVNEATLFRRYGSKENLLTQAIINWLNRTPLNSLEYSGNLPNDLQAIVAAYFKTYQMCGDIVTILLLEIPRHPEIEETAEILRKNLVPAMEIIRKYQEKGMLRNETPLATVISLISPLMISMKFSQVYPDSDFAEIDAAAYIEAFLLGRLSR